MISLGVSGGAEVASNGSLFIREASKSNEGQYLCEASNGVGAGLSTLINLHVHGNYLLEYNKATRVHKTVGVCE